MSDVTQILSRMESGDPQAAEELLPLIYDELRKLAAAKMARENSGHSLQPTALVHEAYMRLVGRDGVTRWHGRAHFFGAAAEAMRRILVENARRKRRQKYGGDRRRAHLPVEELQAQSDDEMLAVHEAVEELEQRWPEQAALVKLRYFVGLTIPEAATALGISRSTAERHWTFARAWLFRHLQHEG